MRVVVNIVVYGLGRVRRFAFTFDSVEAAERWILDRDCEPEPVVGSLFREYAATRYGRYYFDITEVAE